MKLRNLLALENFSESALTRDVPRGTCPDAPVTTVPDTDAPTAGGTTQPQRARRTERIAEALTINTQRHSNALLAEEEYYTRLGLTLTREGWLRREAA